MKKTAIILTLFALIAGSCGLASKKQKGNENIAPESEYPVKEFEYPIKESEYPIKEFEYYNFTQTCFDYEGILGEAAIQLSICFGENEEFWTGSYCYKKYENKIRLTGGINGDKMELTEFIDGKPNGYFIGKLTTDDRDRFDGIWTNAAGTKQLEFKLTLRSSVGYSSIDQRYSDFSATDDEIENFMKKVKQSIAEGDKEWIANNIRYPINTSLNGQEKITIQNKQQLIDNFEQIFYPVYKEEIKKYCTCNMFYNSQGIMLGSGEIWIGKNEIIAINN